MMSMKTSYAKPRYFPLPYPYDPIYIAACRLKGGNM